MNGLHLVKAPSGRYFFAGRVPVNLVTDDSRVAAAIQQLGTGNVARSIAAKYGARFTTSYASREAAESAAAEHGHSVASVSEDRAGAHHA